MKMKGGSNKTHYSPYEKGIVFSRRRQKMMTLQDLRPSDVQREEWLSLAKREGKDKALVPVMNQLLAVTTYLTETYGNRKTYDVLQHMADDVVTLEQK